MTGARCQAGFSLVEAMIAIAVLVPILYVVTGSTGFLRGAVVTNERVADVTTSLERLEARMVELLRPASLDSLQVRPRVGDAWTAPVDDTAYGGVRFRTDDPNEPVTEIEFVMEQSEIPNGRDDDRDGLVDEGTVRILRQGGSVATIANLVERARFTLSGQVLTVEIQCGRRAEGATVYRYGRNLQVRLRNR